MRRPWHHPDEGTGRVVIAGHGRRPPDQAGSDESLPERHSGHAGRRGSDRGHPTDGGQRSGRNGALSPRHRDGDGGEYPAGCI